MSLAERPGVVLDLHEVPAWLGVANANRSETMPHVALVGGGGKTTLLHTIGAALPAPAVLTCTTKMGADQHRSLRRLIDPDDSALLAALRVEDRVVVISRVDGHRAVGVSPERADDFHRLGIAVVAEADGSRRFPVKAPASFEPVIAAAANLVVCVVGADALDRRIVDVAHRPELVAALLECDETDVLTPTRAARLVTDPLGGRKNVPLAATFVVCLNKVRPEADGTAMEFLGAVRDAGVAGVAIRWSDAPAVRRTSNVDVTGSLDS